MIKVLIFLLVLLLIDLFIGLCISFMMHHANSDEPFKFNKDTFKFMLTGWWMYVWRLVIK